MSKLMGSGNGRIERALADLLGGYEGGWNFWCAALTQLELACADSRARGAGAFRAYPPGELNRLLQQIETAARMARLGVEVQMAISDEIDEAERPQLLSTLLLANAHELVAERA